MKLFSDNGHEIRIGDTVETFRGEEVTVIGFRPPHKPGSTGLVCVRFNGGDRRDAEFYPSVIGAHFTEGK
jgi:hypothetical protein